MQASGQRPAAGKRSKTGTRAPRRAKADKAPSKAFADAVQSAKKRAASAVPHMHARSFPSLQAPSKGAVSRKGKGNAVDGERSMASADAAQPVKTKAGSTAGTGQELSEEDQKAVSSLLKIVKDKGAAESSG